MVYKEIPFKKSATIIIWGDSETISVRLKSKSKDLMTHTMHLHPKFWESLFPSYAESSLLGATEDRKTAVFHYRIKACVNSLSTWADGLMRIDDAKDIDEERELKFEEEQRASIEKFIDGIAEKYNKKVLNQ